MLSQGVEELGACCVRTSCRVRPALPRPKLPKPLLQARTSCRTLAMVPTARLRSAVRAGTLAEGHAMAPANSSTQKVSTADQKKRLADGNVVGLGGLWLPYAVYHPLSLRSGWRTAGLGLY